MRTKIGLVAIAALIATATVGWRAVPAPQEAGILGAWIVTSEDDSHQRGLFIFTEANYSIMHVNGGEERSVFAGDTPTDAEMLEAYNTVTANSGRYTLDGDQLTREAYMAKNPTYMAGWPDNDAISTVTIDGDTMTWTYEEGPTFTLRRVG